MGCKNQMDTQQLSDNCDKPSELSCGYQLVNVRQQLPFTRYLFDGAS